MTANVGADQRKSQTTVRGRLYQWKGDDYWSVTTLLKGLPAPQLREWAVTQVAQAAVANWRRIAAMTETSRMERLDTNLPDAVTAEIRKLLGLKLAGPRGGKTAADKVYVVRDDPDAIYRTVQWLRNAPYAEKERKADIGTAIHNRIEQYILGTRPVLVRPLTTPEDEWTLVERYLKQFDDFLSVVQPRFWLAEANVYNRAEAYAGRLDALAFIQSAVPDQELLILWDWKSGKGVYAEAAYQAAAYSRAEFIGLPDGTEVPMPRVDGAAALHLTEDSWEIIPLPIDDDVFRDFLFIREVFDISERRSRGILGQPIRTREALAFLLVGGGPVLTPLDGGRGQIVELHPEIDDD